MITFEAVVEGPRLRVECAGTWEYDSRGTRCGHLLRDAIRRGMRGATTAMAEIVIDFTRVGYLGGDGPGWSVLREAAGGVKVTYLACEGSGRLLRVLFAATNLDRLIDVVIVDARP